METAFGDVANLRASTIRRVPLLLMVVMTGCAGPRMVLKGPIVNKCTDAGLAGCEDLAEGTLLFAEGNQSDGELYLERGLVENVKNADELETFAEGLETIGEIPGAGQYVAPLRPAISIVKAAAQSAKRNAAATSAPAKAEAGAEPPAQAATLAEVVPAQATPQAVPAAVRPPPGVAMSQTPSPIASETRRAELVVVPGHPNARPCEFSGVGKMSCVYEPVSEDRQVSGVLVSSACPFDVLVGGGPATNPNWLVFSGADKGATVIGAFLPISRGQFLTIGIGRRAVDVLPGLRCGVTITWSEGGP